MPDYGQGVDPAPMTLAELARLTVGEPASLRVEIVVIDHEGVVQLVTQVRTGDYWMMRAGHAFRLVARIPAPPAAETPSREPDTVAPSG